MKPLSYKLYFQEDDDNLDFNDKYWDSGLGAAGCIFIAKDTGRILLAHRSSRVDFEPHTWGTWGGKIDEGESPLDAVVREVEEETGYNGKYKINPLWTFEDPECGFKYYNYLILIPFEFTPKLNWENDNSEWVEWGKWSKPMHFGLAALIKNSAPILTKIIKLIKRKKADILEDMNTTPPIIQSTHTFSPRFVDYIKSVENSQKSGFKDNKWYPHHSPEGGTPTIAFGHKIEKNELKTFSDGISNSEAVRLLSDDLSIAKKRVYSDIKSMFGIQIPLEDYQEEMLTDYTFNLGTLKTFPKFVRAVLNKDWDTARTEYIRTYKDGHGKTHTLGRNKIFFDTYLKNLHTDTPKKPSIRKKVPTAITEMIQKQNPNDAVVFKKGIVGDGVFEYEMRSPFSFIRYKFSPKQKLFYFDMIGTPRADDQGKGHATAIMETFFQMVKQYNGTLDCDTYSTSGMEKIKPSIEKLSKRFGVRIVKSQDEDDVDNYKKSDTLSESFGGPGDHVVFGGIWYPYRIEANIITNKLGSPGHTSKMGRMRWTYYQNKKTVFWNSSPDEHQKDTVQKWLNRKGYDVDRNRMMDDQWEFMNSVYKTRDKNEPIAEGERTDYLDQEISKLEAEWDRLDSMGYTPRKADVEKQLAKLQRERQHWRGIYTAVDNVQNQGFATTRKIQENKSVIMEGNKENTVIDFIKDAIRGTEWENHVFLAGGFVRDEIMGKDPHDIDLMIDKPDGGILFATWITRKYNLHPPVTFPTFGTAKFDLRNLHHNGIDLSGVDIECVMARGEKYTPGSRKPEVHFGGLKADIERRDATINSLIKNVSTGEILDLTGKGMDDIKNGIMRTPMDPDVTFSDDPLRMLRFVRQSTKYGFTIDPLSAGGIKRNSDKLTTISKERIRDELDKMLLVDHPDKAMRTLKDLGLLKHVIPELEQAIGLGQNQYHSMDVFDHTMEVLNKTKPVLYQRILALFHDLGKIATKTTTPTGVHFYGHEKYSGVREILTRLKYPSEIINAVELGVENHMRLKSGGDDAIQLTDKALRKFKIEMGEHLEDILSVIHADNISHSTTANMPNQIENVRNRLAALDITVKRPNLPINGNDLKNMNIKPGPIYSEILSVITDKWFENPNLSREEAIEIVKNTLKNN